jgi:hypothetical protein
MVFYVLAVVVVVVVVAVVAVVIVVAVVAVIAVVSFVAVVIVWLSIKEFQLLFPETSKRTLQRELKHLLDLGLLKVEGATNDRRYLVNL